MDGPPRLEAHLLGRNDGQGRIRRDHAKKNGQAWGPQTRGVGGVDLERNRELDKLGVCKQLWGWARGHGLGQQRV